MSGIPPRAEGGGEVAALFGAAREGDTVALARLISVVERGGEGAREVSRLAHPLSGGAYVVGITGAPGAGKSTLTDAVIVRARRSDRVGVLAVDPTSPFSGGAILGDRVRMGRHAQDDGVYIRSMATRGHLGGLALAVPEAVRLLDATGHATVIIETVGVGQVEVEVAGAADTTVVVVTPGWGDSVQAAKAGLMEVADVFAVNKADRPGVRETVRDLEAMLDLSAQVKGNGGGADAAAQGWRPPIVQTTATADGGVDELWDAIVAHRSFMEAGGELRERRRRRLADEVSRIVLRRMEEHTRNLYRDAEGGELIDRMEAREIDPYAAADAVFGGTRTGEESTP